MYCDELRRLPMGGIENRTGSFSWDFDGKNYWTLFVLVLYAVLSSL